MYNLNQYEMIKIAQLHEEIVREKVAARTTEILYDEIFSNPYLTDMEKVAIWGKAKRAIGAVSKTLKNIGGNLGIAAQTSDDVTKATTKMTPSTSVNPFEAKRLNPGTTPTFGGKKFKNTDSNLYRKFKNTAEVDKSKNTSIYKNLNEYDDIKKTEKAIKQYGYGANGTRGF